MTVKPRYARFVCRECMKINHEKVFAEGFDPGLRIRANADLLGSEEGFYCVNERARRVIEINGFQGLSLKPLEGRPWYVVNVARRVRADQTAYTYSIEKCTECGRPKDVTGLITFLDQIEAPSKPGTFFGPTFDRCGSMNGDRDLFVTEDIVLAFKEGGITGGIFEKLLAGKEKAQFDQAVASGTVFKWPKGTKIVL